MYYAIDKKSGKALLFFCSPGLERSFTPFLSALLFHQEICMKKDIDNDHDLTDPSRYRKKIREEDRRSKVPCGSCSQKHECHYAHYCEEYKAWKKRYLSR